MMIDRHIEGIAELISEFIHIPGHYFSPEFIRKAFVCLDISNINEYMDSLEKETWNLYTDFPNVTFPWPFVWGEYTFHKECFNGEKTAKVGILGMTLSKPRDGITGIGVSENTFTQLFVQFLESTSKKRIGITGDMIIELAPDGSIQKDNFVDMRLHGIPNGMQDLTHINELTFIMVTAPMFLATSFCHCKNIKIIEEDNYLKLNKKRLKKDRLPLFRFNTIHIDPMKDILRKEGHSEKTGLKRALHICRGHFATYTENAPLFGKVTGTFWKPMHLKGTKKEGIVIKDYKIANP